MPIFDAFSVTRRKLEKALRPKVWLKSGGFIVINQTEALVAIDVNTGKYVGKTNRLEDTIVKHWPTPMRSRRSYGRSASAISAASSSSTSSIWTSARIARR